MDQMILTFPFFDIDCIEPDSAPNSRTAGRSMDIIAGSPIRHPHSRNDSMLSKEHDNVLSLLHASLGITAELLARKALPYYSEAQELAVAETDAQGRDHLLVPEAANAWQAMKLAAQADGIGIHIVSAFRDLREQADIIRDKLERRLSMETILTLSAPPGYSEHHTGLAVDINTAGCEEREEMFERTDAFHWLTQHAGSFGFILSYPRGNSIGFIYEPWHWRYQPVRKEQA
jgi:zinc D-Ala-D-Ala carboxypeptidase